MDGPVAGWHRVCLALQAGAAAGGEDATEPLVPRALRRGGVAVEREGRRGLALLAKSG